MSQNYIFTLPVEIMIKIFDTLPMKQQLKLMQTCKYWYSILNDDRYHRQRRFVIRDDDNGVFGGCNLKKIQRYRALRIYDTEDRWAREYFEKVRKFLLTRAVRCNLEDLRVSFREHSLHELLVTTQSWHFPKLIRFQEDNVDSEDVVIEAPNLKQLNMLGKCEPRKHLVEKFAEHIEHLECSSLRSIQDVKCSNLQSLILDQQRRATCNCVFHNDVPLVKKQIFSNLKYLKICNDYNFINMEFERIFRSCENLETLIIFGMSMNENAFRAICDMKRLKELWLLVDLRESDRMNSLSLPELEKIALYAGTTAPLGNLPKLKSLRLESHTRSRMKISEGACERYLRAIGDQIEVLHLGKVILDASLIDALPKFENVKTLEMKRMEVVSSFISRISVEWFVNLQCFHCFYKKKADDIIALLSTMPALQKVSVGHCYLQKSCQADPTGIRDLTAVEKNAFCKKLKDEHPDKLVKFTYPEYCECDCEHHRCKLDIEQIR